MRGSTLSALLAVAVASVATAPTGAWAQDLADRVEAVTDGTVRVSFAVRPDVEICEDGIRIGSNRMWWHSEDGWDRPQRCHDGPAEIEVSMRNGRVRRVELVRAGRERTEDAVELGLVPAEDLVSLMLGLARSKMSRRGAGSVLFPVVIADVEEGWRELLELAKDRDVVKEVRKNALFWVGQEAASAATEGLADVAFDDDEKDDVRDAAVFALSQRPDDESIPVLMELAQTAERAQTRKTAMFWLAQSDDDRVLSFFEDVLLGRPGG